MQTNPYTMFQGIRLKKDGVITNEVLESIIEDLGGGSKLSIPTKIGAYGVLKKRIYKRTPCKDTLEQGTLRNVVNGSIGIDIRRYRRP